MDVFLDPPESLNLIKQAVVALGRLVSGAQKACGKEQKRELSRRPFYNRRFVDGFSESKYFHLMAEWQALVNHRVRKGI